MRIRHLVAGAAIGSIVVFAASAGGAAARHAAAPTTAVAVRAVQTAPGVVAETDIDVFAPAAQPVAILTIYVPAGYRAALPGATTKVGDVAVSFRAGTGSAKADGTVTTDDPARHTADPCAPGTHAAVWLLAATVGGRALSIPVYVDPATAA